MYIYLKTTFPLYVVSLLKLNAAAGPPPLPHPPHSQSLNALPTSAWKSSPSTVGWNLNQDASPRICDDEMERAPFSPPVLLWRLFCAVSVCERGSALVLPPRRAKNAGESTRMARSGWPPCLGLGWKRREGEERREALLCRSGVLLLTLWERSDLNERSSRLCCGAEPLLWWLIGMFG